jgi:hypothetical protein
MNITLKMKDMNIMQIVLGGVCIGWKGRGSHETCRHHFKLGGGG